MNTIIGIVIDVLLLVFFLALIPLTSLAIVVIVDGIQDWLL